MVVTDNGVRIIGYTDLAGRLPTQASQLFGTNLVNLLKLLTPGKDGQLVLDLDDRRPARHDGGPGRRAAVAAAAGPGVGRRPRRRPSAVRTPAEKKPPPRPATAQRAAWRRGRPAARRSCGASPRPSFLGHFTVFALAVVVGFYVITNVHHALHTPLMSVTNAISGIIVVGALLQLGHAPTRSSRVLAFAGDPRGQHQRLRWVHRDPPHAPDVPEGREPMTDHQHRSSRPPTSSPRCSSSSRLAGLSKHETAKTGNTFGMVGMAIALVATIWVVFDNRGYAVGCRSPWLLIAVAMIDRRARSACGGPCASR